MPNRPNFPIPPVIDPPRKCLCIEIPWTPEHKQVVAGLFWELTQWFNWQRDSANSGTQLAHVYRDVFNSIDWSDMSCCCNETIPVLSQVDPSNNYLMQISYDGGTTWITNPNSPSLVAPTLPAPVVDGGSVTKCDAASNGLQHVKDLIAKQSSQMTGEITLTEVAIAIAVFIIGLVLATLTEGATIPAIVPVIVTVLGAIFAMGKADFDAYWTTDIYDDILCAFFCNMDDTGRFNDSQANAAIAKIKAVLPASPARDWLIQILHVMGTKGINNLCAYGSSSDSDCASCTCSDLCFAHWLGIDQGAGVPVKSFGSDAHGDYVQFTSISVAGAPRCLVSSNGNYAAPNATDCCNVVAGQIHYFYVAGGAPYTISTAVGRLCGDPDWGHYTGALPNDFWSWESIGSGSDQFHVRFYATAW